MPSGESLKLFTVLGLIRVGCHASNCFILLLTKHCACAEHQPSFITHISIYGAADWFKNVCCVMTMVPVLRTDGLVLTCKILARDN